MALIRSGFRVSLGLEDLHQAKKYKGFVMDKQAIKEVMYGGIKELMNSRRYYYKSSVGKEYCHFTEEGKEAVQSFIMDMAKYITAAEDQELDQRAKDMIMKELKGE
jgi:rRNA-processing protein FCF1